MFEFAGPLFIGTGTAGVTGGGIVSGSASTGGAAEAVTAAAGGSSLAPLALFIGIVLIHQHMTKGKMDGGIEQETLVEDEPVEEKWP